MFGDNQDRKSYHPGRYRLTEDEIVKILKLHSEGHGVTALGQRFNKRPETIARHIRLSKGGKR